ncbi:MAG: 50S ribosomal protein L29 [Candidatus Yanofskybacteria bacterium RIFCSPHIGHO2_02_FULL_41_29]|uniref:Large ribosomal subunit protein uL29 n=1 Tax=Candidatus Yanofskybacteria bacterium RIFCSPHIGHO2_01_FULL_41_53 TaxID=1802663 RepID=A0A1F8EHP5_9BACT|nr:MAG: 50S ribosomal protein L29 [Candidatus Yanofskybacteria bacterium RIFCSPHIGHO2_01_FULL_41_53]OGN11594.1 MAG: 50S ribosomal protein L29 [Candidatus Yanofskybacteria bacterium RIFCSPHIGHO2_02_FULL_41_29]OGN18186.1 MAG: 50S ribosomal protein L29 [Candidatus Yanofskybacteria bacterium RIFCSPHIGHO2_12_FULL_41_9]OGN22831.1 MAG: 50S ribosomal protein L29 [Candidatus Yanofskybacteria bacterium RIFCSPLOWO2_01_FULL_41_67]OGN30098.1 MAG: 50S ribosomal protein L29 [Candidatus Yanofskybacteria bacter
MKSQDLQNKSNDELNRLLADLRSKLLKLNFDLAESKVKDVSQVKKTKKDVARVLTALRSIK